MSTATDQGAIVGRPMQPASYAPAVMDAGYQDFERLMETARIPVMSGTAGDVLTILQERIGNESLKVEAVAKSMGLSKRGLQRRLKAQNLKYIHLRDKVRFKEAIECLLFKEMGVQSTSKYLDFADRTSFTNAFKRWAKISPNTFKKLYRDYV